MITAGSKAKRKVKFFLQSPAFRRNSRSLFVLGVYFICFFSISLLLLLFSLYFMKTPSIHKGGTPGELPSQELSRQLLEKIDQPLPLCSVSPKERDLVIFLFESALPEPAETLSQFLSPVSGREDVKNIKYTVYTAPAAWRSAFLNACGKLKLTCRSGRDCYIAGLKKTVCVDMEAAAADPRGPYASFFHECAHGVCDVLYSDSISGKWPAGLTAQLAAETRLLTCKKETSAAKTELSACIQEVSCKNRMTYSPWEETISDMRSAFAVLDPDSLCVVSDNKNAGYVHEASYWEAPDMPAKEFFAQYFSFMICRNEKALDCLEGSLCGAYPLSSRMVRETVCGVNIAGL